METYPLPFTKRKFFIACVILITTFLQATSQVTSISSIENLSFGAFTRTGGGRGSVLVSNTGLRTATGDIVLLNALGNWQCAGFKIVSTPNTSISGILGPGTTVVLNGSNGGSMLFTLGGTNKTFPFTSSASGIDYFQIGGNLTIENSSSSPPGNYTGNFMVTINYQ